MTEKQQSGFIGTALLALVAICALVFFAAAIWLFRLDRNIKARFSEKRFAPPVEFYSAPESVRPGSTWPAEYFDALFKRKNFRLREFGQPIQPGDFSSWTGEQCRAVLSPSVDQLGAAPGMPQDSLPMQLTRCLAFRNTTQPEEPVQILAFETPERIAQVYSGAQPQAAPVVRIEAELFAQYYGETPALRKVVSLGAVPTNCLNGLLAIEDSKFLEHPGVSVTGLLRAVWTVVRPGMRAQGGSTITQQLVKNYFLTDERTLKRKLTEIPMAVLVERHATKDEILETYINLIYMGQNGPFQVRGFAAASEHYFGKQLADLDLPQCALLTALLNNPRHFNPFNSPEPARNRRAKVLDRMLELKMIEADQAAQAKLAPLPSRPSRALTEPAPYFVQSVRKDLRARGVDESEGLRVYTSLNLRAQETAHQSIRAGLDRLESNYPLLKKLKAQGKHLEAVLVSADPQTGEIEALVGGRGYLVSQFNRATDSHRQVGSIMKPFVFLTAFEATAIDGQPFTPVSPVKDESTTIKFEGQTWTPRNYDGTFNGVVPAFFALKESLNAATANLGVAVGLSNIIDTSRRLGVTSQINPVPSLSLGAFELSPIEVLQSYSTLARLGRKMPLTMLRSVEDLTGKELYKFNAEQEQVVAADTAAELVGVMKQTLITGTGRSARLAGFTHPAAGKTGTTNDKKDAWFAGFTPFHTAVVWVGYDDNTSHNLTGASGAVPIWTQYMKTYGVGFPADDFPWPENVEKVSFTPEQQLALGVPRNEEKQLETIDLVFKKGRAPSRMDSRDVYGN